MLKLLNKECNKDLRVMSKKEILILYVWVLRMNSLQFCP
jgi:hypothetical protein